MVRQLRIVSHLISWHSLWIQTQSKLVKSDNIHIAIMIYDKLMILPLDHRHYIKESPLRNTETAFFFVE